MLTSPSTTARPLSTAVSNGLSHSFRPQQILYRGHPLLENEGALMRPPYFRCCCCSIVDSNHHQARGMTLIRLYLPSSAEPWYSDG